MQQKVSLTMDGGEEVPHVLGPQLKRMDETTGVRPRLPARLPPKPSGVQATMTGSVPLLKANYTPDQLPVTGHFGHTPDPTWRKDSARSLKCGVFRKTTTGRKPATRSATTVPRSPQACAWRSTIGSLGRNTTHTGGALVTSVRMVKRPEPILSAEPS